MKRNKTVKTVVNNTTSNPSELFNKLEELKKKKKELLDRKNAIQEKCAKLNKQLPLPDAQGKSEDFMDFPQFKIRIPRWDMSKIHTRKEGQRVGVFGKSGGGKSYLAMDLMRHNQDIPVWAIFSGSEAANKQFSKFLPNDLMVHYTLDIDALNEIKLRQQKVMKEWRIDNEDGDCIGYSHNPAVGIILDDLAEYESEMKKDPVISFYHCLSRHYKVLYIELFQYYSQLIPKYRRQLSHVFVLATSSEKDLKALYGEFFGGKFSFSVFKEIFNECTKDRGALVLDTQDKSLDNVYFYRAPFPMPKFKVGTKKSKRLQEYFYNEKWDDTTDRIAKQQEWKNIEEETRKLEEELEKEQAILKNQEMAMNDIESN